MRLRWDNEDIEIGAFEFPDRKKPILGIQKGNQCVVYGHFIDKERADEFINRLGELLHVRDENEGDRAE